MIRSTADREAGFSLIELVVVVGIFGILVALSAPAFGRFIRDSRISGVARTLEADLQQAQSVARSGNRTCEVRFQGSGYSGVQVATNSRFLSRSLPAGVTCVATDTATFYPWGLAEPTIVTVTSGELSRTVRVSMTGKVSP